MSKTAQQFSTSPLTKATDPDLANCGISGSCYINSPADHDLIAIKLKEVLAVADSRAGSTPEEAGGERYDRKGVGDGAGVQLPLSHKILSAYAKADLKQGEYGVGHFFLPQEKMQREKAKEILSAILNKYNLEIFSWRETPIDAEVLGRRASDTLPKIKQAIIRPKRGANQSPKELENSLLSAWLEIEQEAAKASVKLHTASLSSQYIIYKGLVRAGQLMDFFTDLKNPDYVANWYISHARYATNSWSEWPNSQPYRISHNGEVSSIHSSMLRRVALGKEVFEMEQNPDWHGSDTKEAAMLNTLLCTQYGLNTPLALLMQFPPMLASDPDLTEEEKQLIRTIRRIIPPNSGPASMAFSDAETFGIFRDPAGFRPAIVTLSTEKDTRKQTLAFGSESTISATNSAPGILRMQPDRGDFLFIKFDRNRNVILNESGNPILFTRKNLLRELIARSQVQGSALQKLLQTKAENRIVLDEEKASPEKIFTIKGAEENDEQTYVESLCFFNKRSRDFLEELAKTGKPKTVAMGDDRVAAVLAGEPCSISDFIKHRWAMVTDPAVDPRCEAENIDTTVTLGANPALTPNAKYIELSSPILEVDALEKVKTSELNHAVIDMTMDDKPEALKHNLMRVCREAEEHAKSGKLLIISDRSLENCAEKNRTAMPDAMVIAAVTNHLRANGLSLSTSIIAESAAATDSHQASVLLAMGASAVYPWLAYKHVLTRKHIAPDVYAGGLSAEKLCANIHKGMLYGHRYILSKRHYLNSESFIGAKEAVMESFGIKTREDEHESKDADELSTAKIFAGMHSACGFYDIDEFEKIYQEQHRLALKSAVPETNRKKNVFSTVWAKAQREMILTNRTDAVLKEGAREREIRLVTSSKFLLKKELEAKFQQPGQAFLRAIEHETKLTTPAKEIQKTTSAQIEEKRRNAKALLQQGINPDKVQVIPLEETAANFAKFQASILAISDHATAAQLDEIAARYAAQIAPEKLTEPERQLMHSLPLSGSEAYLTCAILGEHIYRYGIDAIRAESAARNTLEQAIVAARRIDPDTDPARREELKTAQESAAAKYAEALQNRIFCLQKANHYRKLFAVFSSNPSYRKWLSDEGLLQATDHESQAYAADQIEARNPFLDLGIPSAESRKMLSAFFAQYKNQKFERSNGMVKVQGRYLQDDINATTPSKGWLKYQQIIEEYNEQNPAALHQHLRLKPDQETKKVAVSDVEPISNILTRITQAGMSRGALQPVTHGDLQEAGYAIRIGGSNIGEGGMADDLIGTPRGGSVIQAASGRFGFVAKLIDAVPDYGWIEIKIVQGAKAGVGGELPGAKVSVEIAITRGSIPGQELISPPPHHDLYSIEDLKSFIMLLKSAGKKVGVKLAATGKLAQIACGVAKAGADRINIACNSGGTAAAKHTDHADSGLPSIIGLIETHNRLVDNGLRNNVRLTVSGGITNARDAMIYFACGADDIETGTVQLGSTGCIAIDACNKSAVVTDNSVEKGGCSVGVTNTAWNYLQDRGEYGANPVDENARFNLDLAAAIRAKLAELGLKSVEELRVNHKNWLDFSLPRHFYALYGEAKTRELEQQFLQTMRANPIRRTYDPQAAPTKLALEELENRLDDKVSALLLADPTLEKITETIKPSDIGFGAGFLKTNANGESVYRQRSEANPLYLETSGNAGQRFAAFAAPGFHFTHRGITHDFLGIGMSGGSIIVSPEDRNKEERPENLIVGNSCLYGATGGKVLISGSTGDRFAVRNSGVSALVLGNCGAFAGEYMTGGQLIITGTTNIGLGAGMSGGIIATRKENLARISINKEANSEPYISKAILSDSERSEYLRALYDQFLEATQQSLVAVKIIKNWENEQKDFEILLPTGLVKLQETLRKPASTAALKAAQLQSRDILARYKNSGEKISAFEKIFLSQLANNLGKSLQLEANPLQENKNLEDLGYGNLRQFVSTTVDTQTLDGGLIVAKSGEAPHLQTDVAAAQTAPKCTDCGAKGCQGDSGCGIKRGANSGSKLGEAALTQLFARLKRENPAFDNHKIWDTAQSCLDSGVVLTAEGKFGLYENEIVAFTQAYDAFAGGEYGTPLMFTKHVCPAPCETACTESLNLSLSKKIRPDDKTGGVAIKTYERLLDNFAQKFQKDLRYFHVDQNLRASNQHIKVAVVGSGPAGLEAALNLARRGFSVTVFEKDDGPGGLLHTGIPHEKHVDEMARRSAKLLSDFMNVEFRYNTAATKKNLGEFKFSILATGVTNTPRFLNPKEELNFSTEEHPGVIQKAKEAGLFDARSNTFRCSLKKALENGLVSGIHHAMDFLSLFNKFDQEKSGSLPNLSGMKIATIGEGDSSIDVLTSLHRLAERGLCDPKKIQSFKRNINLRGKITGKGYPERDEAEDPARSTALRNLGISDSELMQPDNFKFDQDGKLIGLYIQPQKLKIPESASLPKEHRKLEDSGERIFVKIDQLILALGYERKENSLLAELGVNINIPGGRTISSLSSGVQKVLQHTTNVPGIFVAGDIDPSQINSKEDAEWTVVNAIAKGQRAARTAIAMLADGHDFSEAAWRKTRKNISAGIADLSDSDTLSRVSRSQGIHPQSRVGSSDSTFPNLRLEAGRTPSHVAKNPRRRRPTSIGYEADLNVNASSRSDAADALNPQSSPHPGFAERLRATSGSVPYDEEQKLSGPPPGQRERGFGPGS